MRKSDEGTVVDRARVELGDPKFCFHLYCSFGFWEPVHTRTARDLYMTRVTREASKTESDGVDHYSGYHRRFIEH